MDVRTSVLFKSIMEPTNKRASIQIHSKFKLSNIQRGPQQDGYHPSSFTFRWSNTGRNVLWDGWLLIHLSTLVCFVV